MSDKSMVFPVCQGPAVVTTSPKDTHYSTSFVAATGEQIGQLSWDDDGLKFSGDVDTCAELFAKLWEPQLKANNYLRVNFYRSHKCIAEVSFTPEAVVFSGEVDQSARDYFTAVHKGFSGLFERNAPATLFFQTEGAAPAPIITVSAAPSPIVTVSAAPSPLLSSGKATFFRRQGQVIEFRNGDSKFLLELRYTAKQFESVLPDQRWHCFIDKVRDEECDTVSTGAVTALYLRTDDQVIVDAALKFTDHATEHVAFTPTGSLSVDLIKFLAVAFECATPGQELSLQDLADLTLSPRFPHEFVVLPEHDNCLSDIGPCPQCGYHEKVLVNVRQWLALTDEGTDSFDDSLDGYRDVEHTGDDDAVCPTCKYQGKLKEWKTLD